jgi:hypothetical protein
LLLFAPTWAHAVDGPYAPEEGDLVFQSLPKGDLVRAIEGISGSHYSHVGLVIRKKDEWYVREALDKVHDTPLVEWEGRGRFHHAFDVYRLRPEYRQYIPELLHHSEAFLGRPYDYKYTWDDEHIYCSELIYKAMFDVSGIRLGKLQRLGDLNWRPYRRTIETYEGGRPPLDREMVTPRSMSEAPELIEVHHGYADDSGS